MDYPKNRKEAAALGLKHYYTGKPCKRGHINIRTLNGDCVDCKKKKDAELYQENREERISRQKKYYHEHKEERIEYNRRHRESLRDYYNEYYRNLYQSDPRRKLSSLVGAAKRRALKIDATPSWYEEEQIKEIYRQCRMITEETGVPHEVDHIVPLNSPLVCGLHCLANLRIIPTSENRKKNNKLVL